MRDATHPSSWPAALDALTAAPKQHRLLFENERVRCLETTILPGERTPMHTHCWPALHWTVSWSDIVRRDDRGEVTFDSRAAGVDFSQQAIRWGEPLAPHTLENVGDKPLVIRSVEIKSKID